MGWSKHKYRRITLQYQDAYLTTYGDASLIGLDIQCGNRYSSTNAQWKNRIKGNLYNKGVFRYSKKDQINEFMRIFDGIPLHFVNRLVFKEIYRQNL